MNDQYEQGYQDGQADLEQNLQDAFKQARNVSTNVEMAVGHQVATITIYTGTDSLLWPLITRLIGWETTESVDGLGDQMLNSHKTDQKTTERDIHLAKTLEKIDEMFGPNGTHRHQITGVTMSDELTV